MNDYVFKTRTKSTPSETMMRALLRSNGRMTLSELRRATPALTVSRKFDDAVNHLLVTNQIRISEGDKPARGATPTIIEVVGNCRF